MFKPNIKVVILTNIEQEYFAVRNHLKRLKTITDSTNRTTYEVGKFTICAYRNIDIAILKMGSGNSVAASYAERVLSFFEPELVLLVGTAGAVRKIKTVGDVIIGSHAYDIQSGRDKDEYFAANPKMAYSSKSLINIAEQVMRTNEWKERSPFDLSEQVVITGALASSEQVIESKSEENTAARLYQRIKQYYASVVAVEMEGFGFLNALKDYNNVEKIIIKGISDKLHDKTEANKQNSREYASANASAFAYEVIHAYYSKKRLFSTSIWKWIIAAIIVLLAVFALRFQDFFSTEAAPNNELTHENTSTIANETSPNDEIIEKPGGTKKTSKKAEPQIVPESQIIQSFSIPNNINCYDELLETMEIPSGWELKKTNATHQVKITYSGTLEKANVGNLVKYSGGHVIVTVDDMLCSHLKELKIEPTLREGNPKGPLEAALQDTVCQRILDNQDLIISTINQCLNDYSSQ